MKEKLIKKMIDYYNGNTKDIAHFLKVYSFAETIGRLEGLDNKTQTILEYSAIVHDIACPLCRIKYGNTNGHYQEIESEALLRDFFKEFDIKKDILERIIYIVSHHHTYTNVDGLDYQILLEADYLVNAHEQEKYYKSLDQFKKNIFKTDSGKYILTSMFK